MYIHLYKVVRESINIINDEWPIRLFEWATLPPREGQRQVGKSGEVGAKSIKYYYIRHYICRRALIRRASMINRDTPRSVTSSNMCAL